MTNAPHRMNSEGGEQIVRRPHTTDALGAALRGAFGGGCPIPDDFLTVLRKLDAQLPN